MKIINHELLPCALLLKTNMGEIKIIPYSESMIRIVYERELTDKSDLDQSLMVCAKANPKIKWNCREDDQNLYFETSALSIQVNRETASFTYRDRTGNLLVKEPDKGGKKLEPVNVYKTVFQQGSKVQEIPSTDGLRSHASEFSQVFDRVSYRMKLEFEWAPGEALYGLGSHEEGILNYRGHQQYLYQQNLKCVIPFLISTKGYGVLVDNYSMMTFHDDVYGSYLWADTASKMDYYFLYGPEFDTIIHQYRSLTGKAPMLPRWAFGYIQSKECYKDQAELLEIVKEYRRRNIPIDMIVLDWKSWTGDLWGQKTLDPERFPQPSKLTQELHSLGVKMMISIWPNLRKGGENHKELLENGFFLGNQSTYDAFNQQARELYWKQAEEGLFSKGIDAWWCDCSEPFEADWKGEIKPEPEQRALLNTAEAKKYLDWEYINAYSLVHAKGIYEGQRKSSSEKRVVNLTRSSYAGQHRYSTISWSGDTSATWDVFRKQIADGLNFCAAGEPYWTVDIGAFFCGGRDCWSKWREDVDSPPCWFLDGVYGKGTEDLGYRELYTRWFQYGAFLPLFRSHGTDYAREVWRFGEPGEVFYDTLVKFIQLRYRLMPYIYSIAGWVTHSDYTMMRLLAFDFRDDPCTYDIKDQFMFGPCLMICPVTTPMYYESGSKELKGTRKERTVYLPKGCSWYDFWTGQRLEGGQTIEADAPIEQIPIYVRAGSILPMCDSAPSTGEQLSFPVQLNVYPGSNSEFCLYNDKGDSYDYEKGAYETIKLTWKDKERSLSFSQREGTYDEMPSERVFSIKVVSSDSKESFKEAMVRYKGNPYTVPVELC